MFKQTTGQRHDDSRVFLVAFQGAVLADTRALILYTWYSSTTAVRRYVWYLYQVYVRTAVYRWSACLSRSISRVHVPPSACS